MKEFQLQTTLGPMLLPYAIKFSNFLTKHKKVYFTQVRLPGTELWVVTNKFDPRNLK